MKEVVYKLALLATVVIALGSVYYTYERGRPCARPVTFAVGAVDRRFDVSTSTVEQEAEAAAEIWNKAAGKTVLAYDPNAALKISLVYDEREAAAKLGGSLASKDAWLSSERERLDALHATLTADEAAYNQKVAEVNAHGGAQKSEYAALEAERLSLNARADELNHEAKAFNAQVQAFNADAASYNQTAGHTFEEGHYAEDSTGRRIEIYEFVGVEQLERVLAHELGHAIGLGHNNDPASIMYAENESGKLTPSEADVAALKKLCNIK